MKITIKRPVGETGPFERPVTLSKVRYRLQVHPSARPGGGVWLSLLDVAGTPLVMSFRLSPGVPDLLEPFRARVDGLPPGVLRCVAPDDPQPADLAGDTVELLYDE